MAHHRCVNIAVLCVLVFFIAVLLHLPIGGGRLLEPDLSKNTRQPIILPAKSHRVTRSFNDHDKLLQVNVGNDLHPRVDASEKSKEFTKAVESGTSLLCMMRMTKEDAAAWAKASPKWADRHPVASRFNDPRDLRLWGWVPDDITEGVKPELKGFMTQLGLEPDSSTEWNQILEIHLEDFKVGDVEGTAIPDALYHTYFNKRKDNIVMVVNAMYSPAPFVESGQYPGPAPDLARPSDVWFLEYYRHGQEVFNFPDPAEIADIPAPRYIFIQDIITNSVIALYEQLYRSKGLMWTDGEGELFVADSEGGKMLLGTKHGSAISMFLIQHKDFFGDLVVKNIRVWHIKTLEERWNLCFEIGRVDEQDKAGGFGGVGRRWDEFVPAKL